MYEDGEFGVIVNKQKAYELYQDIPDREESMNSIGLLLYNKNQYESAAEWYRKWSEKGNPTALNNLGTCYELGNGVQQNITKAYEVYEEAAKKRNSQAMSNLGYIWYKKGKASNSQEQLEEAARWFRSAISADGTMRDSFYYLGLMHQNGHGVEKCYRSAFKYYILAAELDHFIACEKLGNLCYSGYGCVRPDKTKAYEWYEVGAQKGNSQCINNMGLMLENGFDAVLPDPLKAAELYQKAHNRKNTDATFNLGLLYLNSPDIFNIPDEKAMNYIQSSAVRGNARAQDYLINIGITNNRSEFLQSDQKYEIDEFETESEESEEEEEVVLRPKNNGNLPW